MLLLLKIADVSEPVSEYLFSYYSSYKKKFESDCGIDLVIPKEYICYPHETTTIPLGVCCAPFTYKPTGYYLYPRSSLANTPLRLANSVGIIDFSYRGEITAKVDNISDKPYVIDLSKGFVKLFQLCAPDLSPLSFQLVQCLNETERGTGGFGSTNT